MRALFHLSPALCVQNCTAIHAFWVAEFSGAGFLTLRGIKRSQSFRIDEDFNNAEAERLPRKSCSYACAMVKTNRPEPGPPSPGRRRRPVFFGPEDAPCLRAFYMAAGRTCFSCIITKIPVNTSRKLCTGQKINRLFPVNTTTIKTEQNGSVGQERCARTQNESCDYGRRRGHTAAPADL